MGLAAPYPAPGDCASRVSRTQERDQGPGGTVPELREGSAENRPLQPPPGHGAGLPGQRPRKGHTRSPCARENCLPLPIFTSNSAMGRSRQRGENSTHSTQHLGSGRHQAGSWCPVFPVPSWGTGLRQPQDPQQPGTRVRSWGMAGQKGTYVPFPAAKGTVPGAARLPEEGCCRLGWHHTRK